MGYALFASRKQILDSRLNSAQLQQTQRSDEQFALATDQSNLKQQMSSQQAAQAGDLADLYGKLSEVSNSNQRDTINAEIKQKEEQFKQETDAIQRQVYQISIREQAINMEVKRLDTVVTTLTQQLQAMEQAEGQAIERATPKFSGLS